MSAAEPGKPKAPSPGAAPRRPRDERARARPRAGRRRRDLGRAFALALSVIFAVIGAVPLTFGALARTERVRLWAASETARLLHDELGVTASYRLRVEPWPLHLALEDVEVPSNDGGTPFLAAERVDVRPRIFSLLGGRLDAGEIEIVAPRVRAVVRGGVLTNVDYRLPKTEQKTSKTEAPALALGLTDGYVDLTVDDLRVVTREVDLDLGVEPRDDDSALGASIDVALRVGSGSLARVRAVPGRPFEQAIDEDRLCRLDLRARLAGDELVVRRFALEAAVDLDPALGTAPACVLPRDDWRRLEVELGGLRVKGALAFATGASAKLPTVRGRAHLALPLPVAHRFLSLPHVTGQLRFDGTVAHDGKALLPDVEGALRLVEPGIDGKLFSSTIDAELRVDAESVTLADALARWANGEVRIPHAEVRPLEPGVPIETGPIDVKGVDLPGLLRDLGVHPRTHVGWTLSAAHFEGFTGTLSPLSLESPLDVATRDFAIYTKPTYHPQKKRMMGVREGTVKGTFKVTPDAVLLSQMQVDTGRTKLRASVSLGFKNLLGVDVFDGALLDLADITPLVDIPLAGKARVRVNVSGPFDHPVLRGELSVKDFMFGGFPIGDVESAKVFFEPLDVVLTDARVKRGESVVKVPELKLDFDAGASVLADAKVETVGASLEVADLFHMLRFDEDPRWEGIAGRVAGTARIHYALDGREDRCGGGYLSVSSRVHATRVEVFGERFDGGEADLDLVWDDFAAGGQGMRIDVRAARLRKGDGAILAEAFVRHGGLLRGTVVGSGLPLAKLDAMGSLGPKLDATMGMLGELSGTLSQIEGRFDVNVMPVRIGPATLPASRMTIRMEPSKAAPRVLGRTRCGNPRTAEFDRAEYDKDLPDGAFVASGSLLGGQLELRDVRISRQRAKVVTGQVGVRKLDLGGISNLVPGVAFAEKAPKGELSATVDLKRVPLASLGAAEVDVRLEGLALERSGLRAKLLGSKGALSLARDKLTVPTLELEGAVKSGLRAKFQIGGEVRGVTSRPELDLALKLAPTDLSVLAADIPALSRASGTVVADLTVSGPPSALRYGGLARLRGGELKLAGLAVGVTELDFDVVVDRGEARLERGKGRIGGGTIAFGGRVPIRGFELGDAEATLVARAVRVPIADGITVTTDADLDVSSRKPAVAGGERPLPFVKGKVSLVSFSYTRPIALSLSLGDLVPKSARTAVETYDPSQDALAFDLSIQADRPLRFSNNLMDMQLEVVRPGLQVTGTNQRFGARGQLRIMPESKLKLRQNEFDVREGTIRFDDPERVSPRVDLRAITEHRRYATAQTAQSSVSSVAAAQSASLSGLWRIQLHATGELEDLKLGFSSDPPLAQDDVILLLTTGMTRAELDRGLASSLGETVGLEALSSLTGADRAVKNTIPLIDEFRFGSNYSTRSGRTEPTVTLGKRITDALRATVTTTLTENREVRSNLEWRLSPRVSVQGAYDNINDTGASGIGNLGADLRFRLEFE